MSRLQRISQKLIPLFLLIAVAIGSFCFYSNQQYKAEENPLKQAVAEHLEQKNNIKIPTTALKKLNSKKSIFKKQIEEFKQTNEAKNLLEKKEKKSYFKTSIKNKETVFNKIYKFRITHLTKLEIKNVFVYVNEDEISNFTGKILLKNGENKILVLVRYIEKNRKIISVFEEYTVFLKLQTTNSVTPPYSKQKASTSTVKTTNNNKNFSINTNLENKTVYNEKFSFFAKLNNASKKGELSVVLNGKTITSTSENYSVALNIGSNSIRLKTTDIIKGKTVTINQTYTIIFIPTANPETEPKIEYINIKNEQTIKGADFLLNILAKDFSGKRIYKNGIEVKLNDTVIRNKWDSNYSVYKLLFIDGKNTLDIRITDNDGRFADYSYTINCQKAQNGEKIGKINISIDAKVLSLGYIIKTTDFDIIQGDNGAKTIANFLNQNGFEYSNKGTINDGFYLYRITKSGIAQNASIPEELKKEIKNAGLTLNQKHSHDSLGELDFTYASGWMIKINGNFINYNLSDAVFKDGDTLEIRFTLAYGKDIGGYSLNGSGGNFDITW